MHIWLHTSLEGADLSLDMTALSALECILGAMRRGEHFVFGERQTLAKLQKNNFLSLSSRKVLAHIISNFATFAPLSRTVSYRVRITFDGQTGPLRLSADEWDVPLLYVGKYGLAKAVLVAENLDDAELFEHAAKQYAVSQSLTCPISLTKLGGGGSTTPDCLMNAAISERHWVLCISDSDRLHPGQERDSTAKKCEGVANIAGTVCNYWDIPSREVENIIPLGFFEEVIPTTHQKAWVRHRKEIYGKFPEAHHHGDLKLGVSLRKIFSYESNTPPRVFWAAVATNLSSAGIFTSGCISKNICNNSQPQCECIVVHGFGEKILEAVVKILNRRSVHQSCRIAETDPNATHWFDIGKRVFEWGCAMPRMSV